MQSFLHNLTQNYKGGKKMKKLKSIIGIIMSLVMVISFSAFTMSSAPAKKIDTSKFVTINMLVLGNKPTNGQLEQAQAKWNAIFKAKVNANLKLTWVEWTDWYTKYNLLLASGSKGIDLITSASDWLDMWPNAQKGAFMNLDALLPIYAPKTWASIPKNDWSECKYNGKIIAIPEDQYTQWINHGFIYRGDWAKEFGITKPISSWTELGQYFQDIKDKKPDVTPWDAAGNAYAATGGLASFWFNSKTTNIGIDPVPGGIFYGKSSKDPYTVVSALMDGNTLVDFAKTMKDWGDKGYWSEDVLNNKADNWVKMKAGTSGANQHHTQTYVGTYHEMELAQPGANNQFFAFGQENGNLVKMSITHGAMCVAAKSANPERALMVYDLIRNDPQVYKLINYGVEGQSYVIKNGMRDLPANYNFDKQNFYADFWGGRNDKLEIPSATIYPKYKELYASYDKIASPYAYGRFVFNKQPIEAELAAMSDVINQNMNAISFGKAGDPVQAVADFRTQLKAAGYDKALAEVQKQMNAYKKLVTGK
jgi:putative aldouronate transport system substrate-binding protein